MAKVLQLISDGRGNELSITESSSPSFREIFIKLHDAEKERRIGVIDLKNATLNVNRNRKAHLHLKSNSYGFNEHVLKTGRLFNKVLIEDEIGSYLVPLPVLLANGKHQFYKQQGFELQLFIPLQVIEQYKRQPFY